MGGRRLDYFLWNVGGDVDDGSLCFIEGGPEGMGAASVALSLGTPAARNIPARPRIRLRKRNRGLALPGFIGNTSSLLILSRRGIEVIGRICEGQRIEVFPFELMDHANRLHSDDYAIVNPLDRLAWLDADASGARPDASGEIISVKRFVLSARRLEGAPHLFRLAEMPVKCIFSRELGRAFNAAGVTNVRGKKLSQI